MFDHGLMIHLKRRLYTVCELFLALIENPSRSGQRESSFIDKKHDRNGHRNHPPISIATIASVMDDAVDDVFHTGLADGCYGRSYDTWCAGADARSDSGDFVSSTQATDVSFQEA